MSGLRWFGTGCQIVGVFALSGRIVEPAAAFSVMLAGSTAWLVVGLRLREPSLVALNAAFTVSNVLGICRWIAS